MVRHLDQKGVQLDDRCRDMLPESTRNGFHGLPIPTTCPQCLSTSYQLLVAGQRCGHASSVLIESGFASGFPMPHHLSFAENRPVNSQHDSCIALFCNRFRWAELPGVCSRSASPVAGGRGAQLAQQLSAGSGTQDV